MDVLTVSLLTNTLNALLSSAAGDAGKQAWQKLKDTIRRLLGADAPATIETSRDRPDAAATAQALIAASASEDDLRQWLTAWHDEARVIVTTINTIEGGTVTNSISGQVTNSVQAHDIGTITFGQHP